MNSPDKHRPATRVVGSLLLVAGAGLAIFSLIADRIGFGGGEGFGYQQMIVLIVGIVLVLAAVRLLAQPFFGRMGRPHDLAEVER